MQQRSVSTAPANSNRRAFWMRQLRQWHWVSAALSLLGTLLFAATGITLNHASSIEARPEVRLHERVLPEALLSEIQKTPAPSSPLPAAVTAWLAAELTIGATPAPAEWSEDEIYLALPRPGGDAWVSIDRQSGVVQHEITDRGWVSYLNDLHKGRNTGAAWSLFIDAFAVACIVFCVTGLLLLQLYSANRPFTWPLVGFGCALPILIALLLIH
jgi:hypothetical protein